ncbi:MAG: nucleotidyl transferase AbiEii/AbiGii toxin family protein [Candidatus Altiarchaeota archaeon]|nr:nucleotidyl transferase AbiEii/AbiGii toxin family protein [Candidatus Altiarchaeota archaeon]
MKTTYTTEEKEGILGIIETWGREQITQDVFRKIQLQTGIPSGLIETTFWHIDTLYQLKKLEKPPIFKGGTCVQCYIPAGLQRASNDLDFNSRIANPATIREQIKKLNKKLLNKGNATQIKKYGERISYGTFDYQLKDEISGVITFNRRMPSRLGEYVKAGELEVQAKNMKIQVNYKHAWMPAIKTIDKKPRFFILEHQKMKGFTYPSSSLNDLIADKILATTKETGRERFKDVYDLMTLFMQKYEKKQILEKLERILEKKGQQPETTIKSSATNIGRFTEKSLEAQGFKSLVCKDGRKLIENWETNCLKLTEKMNSLLR